MKKRIFLGALISLFAQIPFVSFAKDKITYYSIPAQELPLFKLIGLESSDSSTSDRKNDYRKLVPAFQVSSFITLAEYKIYLKQMKQDSSEAFYKKQLPADQLLSSEIWAKYLEDPVYNKFPAIGISWESAMNFCKWKTLLENENEDEINIMYRLILSSEWVAANHHLTTQNVQHDFNQKYADWTLSTKDESAFFMHEEEFPLDYIYLHRPGDPRAMIRKFVIGDSYLYSLPQLHYYAKYSYYANEGYRHIGFRIVRVVLDPPAKKNPAIKKNLADFIIDYWNLNETHENSTHSIDLGK